MRVRILWKVVRLYRKIWWKKDAIFRKKISRWDSRLILPLTKRWFKNLTKMCHWNRQSHLWTPHLQGRMPQPQTLLSGKKVSQCPIHSSTIHFIIYFLLSMGESPVQWTHKVPICHPLLLASFFLSFRNGHPKPPSNCANSPCFYGWICAKFGNFAAKHEQSKRLLVLRKLLAFLGKKHNSICKKCFTYGIPKWSMFSTANFNAKKHLFHVQRTYQNPYWHEKRRCNILENFGRKFIWRGKSLHLFGSHGLQMAWGSIWQNQNGNFTSSSTWGLYTSN